MAEQTEARYKGSLSGCRAIAGPNGASELELVLNTVFNVGEAPGLIPLEVCDQLPLSPCVNSLAPSAIALWRPAP